MCLVLTSVFIKYLKISDLKGSLAGSVPPRIIMSANLEVQQLLTKDKTERKR